MTVASSRPETVALLVALEAAWDRVGHGVAPEDTTLPYAVLYFAGGGPLDGPVSDPNADGAFLHQVTCVGETAEQAEWLADKLRPVVLGVKALTGRRVMRVYLETSQPGRRDDSAQPPVFYAADQYRILSTP